VHILALYSSKFLGEFDSFHQWSYKGRKHQVALDCGSVSLEGEKENKF
jgi:hypothetical protein